MATLKQRQQFTRELQDQLQDWSAKTDFLRASLNERTSRKHHQYQNLDTLIASLASLRQQLSQLQTASGQEWAAQRERLDQSLAHFRHSYNTLLESATQRPASASPPEENQWHA